MFERRLFRDEHEIFRSTVRKFIECLSQAVCLRGITQCDINIVGGNPIRSSASGLDLRPNCNFGFALCCFLRRSNNLAGYCAYFILADGFFAATKQKRHDQYIN